MCLGDTALQPRAAMLVDGGSAALERDEMMRLPCVCHRLQLPLNAVMQHEVSSRVEFDFNNLII